MKRQIQQAEISKNPQVNLSTEQNEPAWDRFLVGQPAGRHEQTSLWAQIKARSGWSAVRVLLRSGLQIIGGGQLLYRRRAPWIGIGYMSHGPILERASGDHEQLLCESVVSVARELRLTALVLQAPRDHDRLTHLFADRGFLPNRVTPMIDTTAELDLTESEDGLLSRMRWWRRRDIRKALSSPLRFREGGRSDLPVFYKLMLETCRRQGVSPNPSDLDSVQAMWDLYEPNGWMKLFTVELDGSPVSSTLAVPFGDRFWSWKVGWSGEHGKMQPNNLLHWESIRWAKREGYRFFDFMSIDRSLMEPETPSSPRPAGWTKTPGFYKLAFGPRIVALPTPLILFRPSILQSGYRLLYRRRLA